MTRDPSPSPFQADRVFVIAEAGSNWRVGTPSRDRTMGRALIDAAADAGADETSEATEAAVEQTAAEVAEETNGG